MAQRATAELKDQVVNLPGKIEKYRKMLDSGHAPNGESLTEQQRRLLELRVSTFSAQLPDLRQTHIVLPDVTFDHCLSLYGGNREVRLTHYDGHTRGDVVVFLPAEKVLITGDLVDDMPYTGDGSPAELVKTLHELDQLDFDVMIPGHGGIKRGHTHLRQVTQLMEFIVSQVREDVRSGLSLEDTKRKIDVEQFRIPMTAGEEHATRAFDAFVPVAVERAYLEAKETANQ
jgi:glyoxylase-like metal-dependent hydrolase (beta-lactamase superfamily II)